MAEKAKKVVVTWQIEPGTLLKLKAMAAAKGWPLQVAASKAINLGMVALKKEGGANG